MFDKGQKLACINDDFSATIRHLYRQLPRKDAIYTVRDVRIGRLNVTSTTGGGNAVSYLVLLEELHNPDDPYMRDGEEMGFRSDRFAPLEEIENIELAEEKTALAVFVKTITNEASFSGGIRRRSFARSPKGKLGKLIEPRQFT